MGWPEHATRDRGFDSLRFREFARERGYIPNIPTRRCIPDGQQATDLYACDPGLLAKRYVAERTIAWICRNRRLAKDFEERQETTEAWMYLVMIRLLLRRLCPIPGRKVYAPT